MEFSGDSSTNGGRCNFLVTPTDGGKYEVVINFLTMLK